MDSIISLGQKNTLAKYMILSGADNRPPIVAKDLWERIQLLMQCTSLTKQERECKLYDAFDKFTHIKGESLHMYYLRFTQLINDMNIYKMKMEQFQANTKFLNSLPPEWTMVFLIAVASSRFPSINNQLRTSSNPRNQATIQDGKGFTTSGHARIVKCYNCQGDGHMARQCTQPKRPRNDAWYNEKAMLVEAQEARQILDKEQLAFLIDPGIPASQAQKIIPHNAAFQTKDLDTYNSDCDDLLTA
uniref:Retrovirus-related Pol polyprotein from transposon TNT 1-94 n=1 Tax=Tanacetum cinerariifolium TaxID=118510 RepID=A0A699H7Z1_TANCI|nr:retrovirus-related Pol polyprotein from transposon TNT 1-94 [Tanacetum cinerariifolium]